MMYDNSARQIDYLSIVTDRSPQAWRPVRRTEHVAFDDWLWQRSLMSFELSKAFNVSDESTQHVTVLGMVTSLDPKLTKIVYLLSFRLYQVKIYDYVN